MGLSCGDIPGGPGASRAEGQLGGLENWGLLACYCLCCLLVCSFGLPIRLKLRLSIDNNNNNNNNIAC